MSKRYYCTYFDRNYLVRGLSLISSLNRHESSFTIFVVCLDELTRIILKKLDLSNVILVPLHEVEERDIALSAARQNRSVVEYYWTLTPSIILYLIGTHRLEKLTYLDSDLFFFSSPEPIFQEMGKSSILIHAHRFSDKTRWMDIFGIYNVGLMIFKNNADGLSCLKWWRDQCNRWCYDKIEDGKYGDQLYLNQFPHLFNNVHILQHPGAGVAPWNHDQYKIVKESATGTIFVDGYPLVVYHYHSLKFFQPNIIFPICSSSYDFSKGILEICYLPYLYSLHESIAAVWGIIGDYAFGLFDSSIYNAPLVATKNCHSGISAINESEWYSLDEVWNYYGLFIECPQASPTYP